MYRYYQTSEKSAWIPIEDKGWESTEADARAREARKLTILALDTPTPDGMAPDSIRYKGPLYFDIDMKDDLATAIDSGRRLVKKLEGLDVPEVAIEIYCSGSKGLHLIIPMTVFSSGRAISRLPAIYKEIANNLFVRGVDFQVYSGKKGNSFRLVNLKREDGNYRVRITKAELLELTPEKYKEVVSSPRPGVYPAVPKDLKAPQLEILFTEAKKKVNAKPIENRIPLTDALLKKVSSEVPPCVEAVTNFKGIRPSANFNEVALQLAVYLNSTQMADERADSLIDRLANNGDSSKYTTPQMRYEHVTGALAYQKYNAMKFACPAMRGLLSRRPCDGCVLEHEESAGNVNDVLSQIGMIERSDGYYSQAAGGEERMVSNFTMNATSVFIDIPPDGTTPRRDGVVMDLSSRGQFVASVILRESSWNSKSAFLKEIQGLSDLVFLGSDNDVQKIKLHVFKEFENMGEVMQVHSAGVHVDTVSKSKLMTYVEPNMSINEVRVTGTHRLADDVISPPRFADVEICKEGDKNVDAAMSHLCQINSETETAKILGWFIACHLKQHLMIEYKQFPAMNIWGNAGSGKSAVVQMMAFLNGMDMLTGDGAVNATNLTNFAALHYLSSTTTVPRVMEEYNRSKIPHQNYKLLGELFKQSWSGELYTRGTKTGGSALRGGTGAIKIPMSSPVAIVSEQNVDMPALVERTVQVMLSKASRKGRTEHLRSAKRGKDNLMKFGKALMISALLRTPESVADMLEEKGKYIDEDMEDRPRFGLQTCLVGLEFGRQVAKQLELTSTEKHFDTLHDSLTVHVENQKRLTATSEMDEVMGTLGEMIAESSVSHENGPFTLKANDHYIYSEETDTLSISVTLCHIRYRKFMRAVNNQEPAIGNVKVMGTLLEVEGYFIRKQRSSITGQELYVLSLSKMQEKGIDTSLFKL